MNTAKLEIAAVVLLGGIAVAALIKIKNEGVSNLAAGAVSAVGDAAAGAVLGVGDVLGVPRTNVSQGEAEWAAGDYWNASFHLPAGAFLGHVWESITN